MTAMDILSSVTSYTSIMDTNRKVKMAVIDPSYNPVINPLPRVTFAGESTMSTKFYAVMSPYVPIPGDTVIMLPIGHTYIVCGSTTPIAQSNLVVGIFSSQISQNINTGSWIYIDWNAPIYNPLGISAGISITPPLKGLYKIEVKVGFNSASGAGTQGNLVVRVQKNFTSDPSTSSPDGTGFNRQANPLNSNATRSVSDFTPLTFNGTTDFLRVGTQQTTGVTLTTRTLEDADGQPDAASLLFLTRIGE